MAFARVEVVKVVVNSGPLFRAGGLVKRWMVGVQREMTTNSRRAAPRRTGELKAGIGGNTATTGARRVTGTTTSRAPYTRFVVYGTTGPILPSHRARRRFLIGKRKKAWLRLRAGNGYPVLYREAVAGQSANNFFYRGYVATKANHSSLPPARPL